jgi:hypothetical protein
MSHDHGSVPRLETLRTYVEYHAMLVVAGELIDEERAVLISPYEDAADPWRRWLSRYLDTNPSYWLADIRMPAPATRVFLGDFPKEDQWRHVTGAEYDRELGLEENVAPTDLVVSSHVDLWDSDRHGSARVTSALASPETSAALLRALQTASDPTDYRLPDEGEGHEDFGVEIDDAPFRLLGWLRDIDTERECLEEHDPLSRIRYRFSAPGRDVVSRRSWRVSANGLTYLADAGTVVASLMVWSDQVADEKGRIRAPYSEGKRTSVNLAELLEYLNERKFDLIMEVQIARNWETRRDKDHDYEPGRTRVYLLRCDGSIEATDRRRSTWQADRR